MRTLDLRKVSFLVMSISLLTVFSITPATANSDKAQTTKTWAYSGDDSEKGVVGKSEDAQDAEVAEFVQQLESEGYDVDSIREQVFESFDGLDIDALMDQVEIAEI